MFHSKSAKAKEEVKESSQDSMEMEFLFKPASKEDSNSSKNNSTQEQDKLFSVVMPKKLRKDTPWIDFSFNISQGSSLEKEKEGLESKENSLEVKNS